MMLARSKINGKIWYFVDDAILVEVTVDIDQQITLKLTCSNIMCFAILVYAKYNDSETLKL